MKNLVTFEWQMPELRYNIKKDNSSGQANDFLAAKDNKNKNKRARLVMMNEVVNDKYIRGAQKALDNFSKNKRVNERMNKYVRAIHISYPELNKMNAF